MKQDFFCTWVAALLLYCIFVSYQVNGQQCAVKPNIKTALFPTLPYAFTNDYFLGIQYERAFSTQPTYTYAAQLLYNNYYYNAYYNSQQVSASQMLSWTAKLGPRYYFRKSSRKHDAYRGLFVGIAPFYSRQLLWNGLEERHNFGLDAMIGYQRIIKRLSFEVNSSWGYNRSWYRFHTSPPSPAFPFKQEGVRYLNPIWAQINIGYLF